MCKPDMLVKLFKIMCKNNMFKGAFALFHKKKEGVLSVEAAVCVPLFLIASVLLLSIATLFYVNEKVAVAANEEAKELALNAYGDNSISNDQLRERMIERIGATVLNSGFIINGETGLDLSESDLGNKEIVVIDVKYTYTFPFIIFSQFEIPCEKKVVMHTWVGYINGLTSFYADEYVYMTKNGTVYHRSRECSHIRLSITKVNMSDIGSLRNRYGSKYKECLYCRTYANGVTCYITSDGDRYHSSLSCGGLKRTVLRIKLSGTGGVPPCSRCGR